MDVDRDTGGRTGLLYPMLVIAAVAVITFSVLGIVSMMGWLPVAAQGTSSIDSRSHAADGAQNRVAPPPAQTAR